MIWIIGNKGMLGTELSLHFAEMGIPYVGTDRELSILDTEALEEFAAAKPISWIVNCAAYTAVDKAEDEPDSCYALNAQGPENIGRLASSIGARVLHISTDYVFSGIPMVEHGQPRPYREDDPVGPTGVYGKTKAEGEMRLMQAAPDSIIIRTAWLYGKHGNNFVYTMLRLMKERNSLGVVADQIGSPTWAFDLAQVIRMLIAPEVGAEDISAFPPAGMYHFTNEGQTSWYEFACEIHRLGRMLGHLDHDCRINPLRTDQYPTRARRPAYSVLSKEKIKTLGIPVPHWRASLEAFFKTI